MCLPISREVMQTLGAPMHMRLSGLIKTAMEGWEAVEIRCVTWTDACNRIVQVSDVIEVNFQTTSYFSEILPFGDGGQNV